MARSDGLLASSPWMVSLSEAGGLEVKGVDAEARWPGFEFQLCLFIGSVTGFK